MSGRTSRPLVSPDVLLGYVDRARSDPPAAFEQHSFEGIIAPTTPNCLVRITSDPTPRVGNCRCNEYRTLGDASRALLQAAESIADWGKEPLIHARFTARSTGPEAQAKSTGQKHREDQ